jgi:hypothetical protein
MFEVRIEWEEAPGVRDPILARTWARLDMWVHGRPALELFDSRSNSVRNGVYGSVFPLASWITDNWWNILYEDAPSVTVFDGARKLFQRNPSGYSAWIRRHNMLSAREGYALPDMSIFRDEDRIFIRWLPDPPQDHQTRRFIGEGSERLDPYIVRDQLARVVTSVLERTSGQSGAEVEELKENWDAIQRSDKEEAPLCQALAALGEDPYHPEGIDEDLISLIENRINVLSPLLRDDLLDAATQKSLVADCARVEMFSNQLGQGAAPAKAWADLGARITGKGLWPHHDGYARARQVRQELGLEPDISIPDIEWLIENRLGDFQSIFLQNCPRGAQVDGLLGTDKHGIRTLVAEDRKSPGQRFLMARALHHWLYTLRNGDQRLLTHSHGWEQRASRAFAAEFLAPAAALQQRLDEIADIDEDTLDTLAHEFQVSAKVIEHQIENHAIF